jgi:hypothetical protein
MFHAAQKSLARANLLVVGSLLLTLKISHFPHVQSTVWLLVPALGVAAGTLDTTRCMKRRWSFYHGGVLLCLYMDLMVGTMVLFILFYPAVMWLTSLR